MNMYIPYSNVKPWISASPQINATKPFKYHMYWLTYVIVYHEKL